MPHRRSPRSSRLSGTDVAQQTWHLHHATAAGTTPGEPGRRLKAIVVRLSSRRVVGSPAKSHRVDRPPTDPESLSNGALRALSLVKHPTDFLNHRRCDHCSALPQKVVLPRLFCPLQRGRSCADVFRRPCRAKNWLSRRPDPHDQPNIYYTFVQRPFWTEYALFLSTRQRLVLCQWCFDMWHSRPWPCNPSHTAEGGCATGGLHDKKAWQWCANLRQWAEKAQSELEVRILQSRAERRGRMTARSR